MGAGGAAVGHGLTRALGRVAKPIGDEAADTLALQAQGVMPTFGQGMGQKGGVVGRAVDTVEQGAQSLPIVSGPLRQSRAAARDQWRQATRNAALPDNLPAGTPARNVDDVRVALGGAYDRALDPIPMPYASVQYQPDIRRITRGIPLSQEQRVMLDETFQGLRLNHMQNPNGVQPTAAAAQQIESELKSQAARFTSNPAQADLGRAFNNLARDFGNTWRGSLPAPVRSRVAEIDAVYPDFAAIRQAAKTTGAVASEGVPSNYSPAVLTRAARTVDRTPMKGGYIRGEAPQQELARLGQTLVDTVPDSGTALRGMIGTGVLGGSALTGLLPGALAGGAGLAAYGTQPVQNYLMGRAAPMTQQAILDALRAASPYGAAFGASVPN
jgi:hypothetical protein